MPKEDSYDWEHERSVTARGKDICNWLIHSYVFFVVSDENDIIKFFCVSSDYDRNKVLYKVPISDWLSYIDFIASDDIVQMDCHFNNKKGDYIFTQKKRGE